MREQWFQVGMLSGFDEALLERVWAESLDGALHVCPKAHMVGEALLGYRCAYVRAHYPAEFLEAIRDVFGEDSWIRFDGDDHLEWR